MIITKTLFKIIKIGDVMKISGSILKIKNDKNRIKEIIGSGIDYLHLDVMDGIFVDNISLQYNECDKIKELFKIPLDIHLMVQNPIDYIKDFIKLEPKYISFHIEANDIDKCIDYIKKTKTLVGLAINPATKLEKILPYLEHVDLILVMSVEPGYGGQTFINSSLEKINYLNEYRIKNNLKFKIEVDGGINIDNIKKINSDIVVIGSGITDSDNYKEQVNRIKGLL